MTSETIQANRKLINQIKIPIRWVDLDAYAHVNNAKYFEYMSEARTELLGELVNDPEHPQFYLINTQCTFKKSFAYPGVVVLNQYLVSIGNTSIHLYYEFSIESNPEVLYAEGTATLVCFNPKLGKPTRVTDSVRKLLQG